MNRRISIKDPTTCDLRSAPACWLWDIPPVRNRSAEIAHAFADSSNSNTEQLSPLALELLYTDMAEVRFIEFHSGVRGLLSVGVSGGLRCAICGLKSVDPVDDHDHGTGLRRGFLCRSCNICEGRGDESVTYEMYRLRSPAEILDHHEFYVGRGWRYGWWDKQFASDDVVAPVVSPCR